jgi:hypothetical protein
MPNPSTGEGAAFSGAGWSANCKLVMIKSSKVKSESKRDEKII